MRLFLCLLAVLLCGAANAQTMGQSGGSSSLVIGTTPITGGTAGCVLFQSSAAVACGANFTFNGTSTLDTAQTSWQFNANGSKYLDFGATIAGKLFINADAVITSGSQLIYNTRSKLYADTDGTFVVWNNAQNAFTLFKLGGTTSSFPALNRNGTALESKLADNSAFADFHAASLSATLASAVGTNAVCNTPGASTALTVQVWATGCASSTARDKQDIADLDREQAFKTVMALQPVSYFYRPEAKEGSDRHIGFIAEQVGAIDPSMITFGDDGVTPHAVKYNEMWPLFAASIQKLKAEIDALKAPRRKVRLLRRLTEIDDLRTSK